MCAALLFACGAGSLLRGSAEPVRPAPAGAQYVGKAVCASCHVDIAEVHAVSGMGRAMELVENATILQANPKLTLKRGRFTFTLERRGDQTIYSVTDGTATLSEPVLYAVGQGKAGQTYVYRHDGKFYESTVSFYRALKGLDVTIGHPPPLDSATLVEALGRLTPAGEIRDCFGCHSTAAIVDNQVKLDQLVPGVNCESCHGPGSAHVAAVKAGTGEGQDTKIFNPGKLTGDEINQEFCGKCHRSAEQVLFMPNQAGVNNVRFQPYRMFGSKCYSDDKRISCIACHDPHAPLQQEASAYDAKCLACHKAKTGSPTPSMASANEPACPVATSQCTNCHMPKYDLPGAHLKFTDHRIRIARPDEPYPN